MRALREKLDQIARKGAMHLRKWVLKESFEAAILKLSLFSLVFPALVLLLILASFITGTVLWPFSLLPTLLLFILVPSGLVMTYTAILFSRYKVDRRIALALYDQKLGLKDRLQTADEFAASGQHEGFYGAAIENADASADAAMGMQLPEVNLGRSEMRVQNAWLGGVALALLLLSLWLGQIDWQLGQGQNRILSGNNVDPSVPVAQNAVTGELEPPENQVLNQAKPRLAEKTPADSKKDQPNSNPVSHEKSSDANKQSGQTASSSSATSAQQNQSASSQSDASGKSGKKQEQKPSEATNKKKNTSPAEEQKENDKSASGVSGGKGGATGKQPSSSDYPAVRNKAQHDDSNMDNNGDEADEEEDEEQKAGASRKPSISERKAPANRSLTPSGTGNQENKDVNGRGGPGGLKKTRGVAAMLLGVPMPDRLQGMNNPGRVKVQREQGQAEEKFVESLAAQERQARDESMGFIAHKQLSPWMKNLVRDYFLASNKQTREKGKDDL